MRCEYIKYALFSAITGNTSAEYAVSEESAQRERKRVNSRHKKARIAFNAMRA